jgi:hypothetical protein
MHNVAFLILVFTVLFNRSAFAQTAGNKSNGNLLYGVVLDNGDTLYMSEIDEIKIYPLPKFSSKRDLRRYQKLVRNVKKVYPYAKMAGERYREVEQHLLSLKTDRERKLYLKKVEAEIVEQYEDDLKELTISQGRILLKLIDRETGETSYQLLKEFKNSFSAIFWQTFARIFGHNLKSEFDPLGEDKLLNEIVVLIENGQL